MDSLRIALATFCFGYPFVMAWYWMAGGLLYWWFRERHEPLPTEAPVLSQYPLVSILVPCYNQAVTWCVRRILSDGRLGGITGNPRLRKRSQTILGWLFTVSGVICCFCKRALRRLYDGAPVNSFTLPIAMGRRL